MPLLTLPGASALSLSVRAKALVFEDPKSFALLARVREIAPGRSPVLITGETGTGRELVARHVHDLSPRAGRPFLAVNCSGFARDAAECELLGQVKGAFDGAGSGRAGWVETAHGGTLFLDEIGDLSPALQEHLLRVLERGELLRVGASKPAFVDVRLIAATSLELEDALRAGHFRGDLLSMLSGVTLELAPLRERTGDILPLARHFLEIYRERLDLRPTELSAEAAQRLLEYSWPGNIRELENAMHHALLLSQGAQITPADLRLSACAQGTARAHVNGLERALLDLFADPRDELFDYVEATLVRLAYHYCDRNQLQTARLLGISRNVVRARLIRLGEITGVVRSTPSRAPAAREIVG